MALDWLRHAFAIEARGQFVPTDAQRAMVEQLCRAVIAREMVVPALILLESLKPLNFVTGQALRFFAPLLTAFKDSRAPEELSKFLEHRGALDFLAARLEELSRPVPADPSAPSTTPAVSPSAGDGEHPPG
jgi:hypothetical protein